MAVMLGGIALDDDLRLDGLLIGASIAGSARATFGGITVQTMAMPVGKQLQLVATSSGDAIYGAFLYQQLLQVAAIRDAGAPVLLSHPLFTGMVWLPPDAISVEQVFDHVNPQNDAWYTGSITMITV